jgi:hypothetical protein
MKKFFLSSFIVPTILVLITGIACSASTIISQPTNTPTATLLSTSTRTSHPTSKPPTATPYPDFFTETFLGDLHNWSRNITQGDSSLFSRTQTDNGLRLQLDDPNLYVYYYYDPFTYQNVRLDLKYKNLGHNSNNINLVCRNSEDGWYEFTVQNDGLYQIWAFDDIGDRNYVMLASGGSTAIRSGYQENEIAVTCIGNTLTLYINGEKIKSISDNQFVFSTGLVGFGVNISFYNPVTPVIVELESLTISQP